MQPDDIIKQFEVYVDDLTELSTYEEYQLLTKTLTTLYNNRSWEFLRKAGSVTLTTATSAPLPSDFLAFMPNYNEDIYNNIPEKAVVYVGTIPYTIIPMGARAQKANGMYAYADIANRTLNFTVSIGAGQVATFDYKYKPADITSNSSTIALPSQFHRNLPQIMAIDDDIIQKMEKARSNREENMAIYKQTIQDMAHDNARFLNY